MSEMQSLRFLRDVVLYIGLKALLTEYAVRREGMRARLIARDQTSKMNVAINMARQTSIGIEEYIWRTAKDRRVVGTPGGLWPEGNAMHGNHYKREGKTYRWDNPPHDGHPGWPINCRCYPEPVLDPDKLRSAA